LLATGTDDAHRLGLPARVEILKLPALRKVANDQYLSRRMPVGPDAIRRLRASLLEASVRSFEPQVILLDKHPFGARGEFRAGLVAACQQGARIVLGLRDILDEPATVRREWAEYGLQQAMAATHDLVLIYGEQLVFDPVARYGFPEYLADRTLFCGYVVHPDDETVVEAETIRIPKSVPHRPIVLASAGGGEDGAALLDNFLRAAEGASWQGVAVAGPMTPEPDFQRLCALAGHTGTVLRAFVPRLPSLFSQAHAVVSMGGYNTLTEALSVALPIVCVPRSGPRAEQFLRARAFGDLNLLEVLEPDHLTPTTMGAAVLRALATSRGALRGRVRAVLSFDGAERAARELVALAISPAAAPRYMLASLD
jgi:predicted glycosyltransferase